MRSFKSLGFFLFGIFLAVLMLASYAHAETIPSNQTSDSIIQYGILVEPNVCDSVPATVSSWVPYSSAKSEQDATWPQNCSGKSQTLISSSLSISGNYAFDYSQNGGTYHANWTLPTREWCSPSDHAPPCVTYSCPSGYTISSDGLSCSRPDCPPGSERNSAGDCVTPCPPVGDNRHSGEYATYSSSISNVGGVCIDGCSYSAVNPNKTCIDGTCGTYIGGSTGNSCGSTDIIPIILSSDNPTDPSDEPAPVPNNPDAPGTGDAQSSPAPQTTEEQCTALGMGYITISGVTTCVPAGTGGEKVTQDEKIITDNPDDTKNEQTQSTTKNPDGSVTQTIGNCVIYPNGEKICNEPQTTNYSSESGFCQQNPTASICSKNQASGGGTCDAPPVCSGDPATCAILRQQWETRCEVKRQSDFTSDAGSVKGTFPDLDQEIADKKDQLGSIMAQIKAEAMSLISFNGGQGAGSLGCPAGPTVLGQQFTLCFDKYSGQLSMVGAAVVFMSLVISLFIIFS